ncbi:MAG: hypothetical protein AB7K24_34945, partial [Gemmataceae bacterium]
MRSETGQIEQQQLKIPIFEHHLAIYKTDKLEAGHTLKLPGKKEIYSHFVPGRSDRLAATRADSDGTVLVFDVKTGAQIETFKHPKPKMRAVRDFRLDPALGGKLKTWWEADVPSYGAPQPGSAAMMWQPPDKKD